MRQFLGAIGRDGLRFERLVRGRWELIHNRFETISTDADGGVRCEWRWTSPVDYCRFVPGADARLLRAALRRWPVAFGDSPPEAPPEVTFLIGHRGTSRLPHLLATLRSIAAQRGAAVECVVVEQSHVREAAGELPAWVRYVHQPVPEGAPYNRSATFNLGAASARGRILVLHDNDMLVPVRYAAEVVRLADAGWEAIDLKRFIFYFTTRSSEEVLRDQTVRGDERSEVVIQNLHGGSVAVSRQGFEAIGGFDESFVGWGGEDLDFWDRAEILRATRFGYLPIVHLWHAPQPEKARPDGAPAVQRYEELAAISPHERIAALRRPGR